MHLNKHKDRTISALSRNSDQINKESISIRPKMDQAGCSHSCRGYANKGVLSKSINIHG